MAAAFRIGPVAVDDLDPHARRGSKSRDEDRGRKAPTSGRTPAGTDPSGPRPSARNRHFPARREPSPVISSSLKFCQGRRSTCRRRHPPSRHNASAIERMSQRPSFAQPSDRRRTRDKACPFCWRAACSAPAQPAGVQGRVAAAFDRAKRSMKHAPCHRRAATGPARQPRCRRRQRLHGPLPTARRQSCRRSALPRQADGPTSNPIGR